MEEFLSVIESILPALGAVVGIPPAVAGLVVGIASQAARTALRTDDPVQTLRDTLTRMIQEDLNRTH